MARLGVSLWKATVAIIRDLIEQARQHPAAGWGFLAAISVLPLLFLVLTILLPLFSEPFEQPVLARSAAMKALLAWSQPATVGTENPQAAKWHALQIEAVFWQNRLALAKRDGVQLSIDLPDSSIGLEIRGILARRAKIVQFRQSRLLESYRHHDKIVRWLAAPFTLQREFATLPKAPIRIVDAPEDTLQAQNTAADEVWVERQDVSFSLFFDRNLVITVDQVQTPSFAGWLHKAFYNFRHSFSGLREVFSHLLHRQAPPPKIWLDLEVSREDAKAIYRALPEEAQLALRVQ